MANEEQLAILRQGVEVWNRWRMEHPIIEVDLQNADLHGVVLEGAKLAGTNLYGAKLAGADLQEAILYRADLQEANLQGANLERANLQQAILYGAEIEEGYLYQADLYGANLERANLERANLQGANLHEANLHEANLQRARLQATRLQAANLHGARLQAANLERANLERANLQGANLYGASLIGANVTHVEAGTTNFSNLDLRGVHSLETVRHIAPSAIGIDTLYRSKGQIPEVFLRGCGVPDSMIEYARSLVAAERPIDYYSVFISYSSKDDTLAQRLYADLQAKGVRCWLAPHDLTPGEVIVRGIDEAIRLHDKVVLLLSEAAVSSHWVAYEVNLATTREAREGRTVLYPLRLDDAVLTTTQGWAQALREGRHIGDLRQWTEYTAYQGVFGRLLKDLKAEQQ